jgi:hypothetical protein
MMQFQQKSQHPRGEIKSPTQFHTLLSDARVEAKSHAHADGSEDTQKKR